MKRSFFFTRFLPLLVLLALAGCTRVETHSMTVTAYCGCGECNGYTRGHWYFLKLDFWNRVINYGPHRGEPYDARTACGDRLRRFHPGLVSLDSLIHPWQIPLRLVFPWLWWAQDGTIAADTRYYPFGTRMFIPGWGWGQVTDRGGAIKGPEHIDIYLSTHGQTERWGRPRLEVKIEK